MDPHKLGDQVKVKQNERAGVVVGIWHALYDTTQYLVRFVDSTGDLAETWVHREEIAPVEDSESA